MHPANVELLVSLFPDQTESQVTSKSHICSASSNMGAVVRPLDLFLSEVLFV